MNLLQSEGKHTLMLLHFSAHGWQSALHSGGRRSGVGLLRMKLRGQRRLVAVPQLEAVPDPCAGRLRELVRWWMCGDGPERLHGCLLRHVHRSLHLQ